MYVYIHTYYVLINPPMPIYYVLAAVFASCFYVLFKIRFVREATKGDPFKPLIYIPPSKA